MLTAVLLTTTGGISVITNPCKQSELMENLKPVIGGWLEHVNPVGLPEPYCMMVDEEGLLKGKDINLVATLLYDKDANVRIVKRDGTKGKTVMVETENMIVGDVVIIKEGIVDGEYDLMGLDIDDVEPVLKIIDELVGKYGI